MAIALQQTGRTRTSVTFSIGGISHDREILVFVPSQNQLISLSNTGMRYSGATTNGSITIYPPTTSIDAGYKLWQFKVLDKLNGALVGESALLNTILEFYWDNTPIKQVDAFIDITYDDLIRLYWFTSYMSFWIGEVQVDPNPKNPQHISAKDVYNNATNISNAINKVGLSQLPLGVAENIAKNMTKIINATTLINGTEQESLIYADYFNYFKDAINSFSLQI